MNVLICVASLIASGCLFGCQNVKAGELSKKQHSSTDNLNVSYRPGTYFNGDLIGPWKNEYTDNALLAGVVVTTMPAEPEEALAFKPGSHPCQIRYLFWNGMVEERRYSPNGELSSKSSFVLNIDDSKLWNRVDFSYGSDPDFKTHKDPRLK